MDSVARRGDGPVAADEVSRPYFSSLLRRKKDRLLGDRRTRADEKDASRKTPELNFMSTAVLFYSPEASRHDFVRT